jgi:1-acyl-sn-glycerol-3-phosphate acyltransferase
MIILRYLLAFIRLIIFAIVTLLIYGALLFSNLFYTSPELKLKRGILYRRSMIRCLHIILGSKITTYGNEPIQAGLIISNHRSYFDPIVILKNILAYPVGKKEVASWPIIGSVCKTTGVIFVKRENKESRKNTLLEINTVLEKGYSIFIAPEGTTHIEPTTINFNPGAFAQASKLGVPVIPVAIDFKNLDDAWIGDDTFVPHFLRCFGKWRTEIKVSYLQPIISADVDQLIYSTKNGIDSELIRFRKDWEA